MNLDYDIWIAMATLKPLEGNNDLGGASGAIVNILDCAINKEDFILKAQNKLNEFGFYLVELEDIELFNFDKNYDDNLNEIAEQVKISKNFRWGSFYTYDEEE